MRGQHGSAPLFPSSRQLRSSVPLVRSPRFPRLLTLSAFQVSFSRLMSAPPIAHFVHFSRPLISSFPHVFSSCHPLVRCSRSLQPHQLLDRISLQLLSSAPLVRNSRPLPSCTPLALSHRQLLSCATLISFPRSLPSSAPLIRCPAPLVRCHHLLLSSDLLVRPPRPLPHFSSYPLLIVRSFQPTSGPLIRSPLSTAPARSSHPLPLCTRNRCPPPRLSSGSLVSSSRKLHSPTPLARSSRPCIWSALLAHFLVNSSRVLLSSVPLICSSPSLTSSAPLVRSPRPHPSPVPLARSSHQLPSSALVVLWSAPLHRALVRYPRPLLSTAPLVSTSAPLVPSVCSSRISLSFDAFVCSTYASSSSAPPIYPSPSLLSSASLVRSSLAGSVGEWPARSALCQRRTTPRARRDCFPIVVATAVADSRRPPPLQEGFRVRPGGPTRSWVMHRSGSRLSPRGGTGGGGGLRPPGPLDRPALAPQPRAQVPCGSPSPCPSRRHIASPPLCPAPPPLCASCVGTYSLNKPPLCRNRAI